MRVRLLGPVDVVVDGEPRPVRGERRKAVLAVLALHQGTIVSTEELVAAVWDGSAPSTAANTLQSHLSHLRGVFGDRSAILARSPGYLLAVPTDLQDAERLLEQARTAGTPGERLTCLRTALALWRGRPLQDTGDQKWLVEQADRLERLRAQAVLDVIDTRLALGEHVALVGDLERLVLERPFDEQLHAQLMLALYRAGRQADALAVARRLRRALHEELGIDPGQAVREREAAILRRDPALNQPVGQADQPDPADQADQPDAADPAVRVVAGGDEVGERVPRQLPPAVAGFAGRVAELATLDALLAVEPRTVLISAVSGTAGVGKTALAVHWAHRVADRFPDGQLYANLRGFDPTGRALEPADALRGFLEALGVRAERVPAELAAQAALFRSTLAGRRMLVVLDNARDVDQVRPLLPGAAGCLVLVTSRNDLAPLVAGDDVRALPLDLLSAAEASDLLARRLGAARVAAEPHAVHRLVECCARLPLALAVVAARAAHRPGFPLAALADALTPAGGGGLDELDAGDPSTDVRAVFSWSYAALGAAAARLFRLLGLHPGPELSLRAAASLAGLPEEAARALVAELGAAHLVTEPAPGTYGCHDLLRAYAAELAADDPDRVAALTRMLDHYLHTADAAATVLYPNRDRVTLAPPSPLPEVSVDEPAGERAGVLEWFSARMPVLLACVELAARAGLDTYAWRLAWCLVSPLDGQGRWRETIGSQQVGLAAATRLGHRKAQANAHRRLAGAYLRLGELTPAHTHAQAALSLCRDLGDIAELAHSEYFAAIVCSARGRHAEALEHGLAALAHFREIGYALGETQSLNSVGWYHAQLGDYEQALAYCLRALAMHQELGDQTSAGDTLDSIGYAHHMLGQYEQAVARYEQALAVHRGFGERYQEGDTLVNLGDSLAAAGEVAAARLRWQEALEIFTDLGHHEAARAAERLAGS
jgi:DNA-binding SARP family transcriptional activator/tetratricopeptide (TPR) repeat protein